MWTTNYFPLLPEAPPVLVPPEVDDPADDVPLVPDPLAGAAVPVPVPVLDPMPLGLTPAAGEPDSSPYRTNMGSPAICMSKHASDESWQTNVGRQQKDH